jgi:hypothetical protein
MTSHVAGETVNTEDRLKTFEPPSASGSREQLAAEADAEIARINHAVCRKAAVDFVENLIDWDQPTTYRKIKAVGQRAMDLAQEIRGGKAGAA